MTATIEAVFDGKVLKLATPLALAPNTRVRITIETVDALPTDQPSFLHTARSLTIDAPADFASNL